MRLRDLDASFLFDESPTLNRHVDTLAEAHGVMFQCPNCATGKEVLDEVIEGTPRRFVRGAHYVICWLCGVPEDRDPKPGRWRPEGTSLDDLTLAECPGKTRSVLLLGACGWHGYVTNGDAQ